MPYWSHTGAKNSLVRPSVTGALLRTVNRNKDLEIVQRKLPSHIRKLRRKLEAEAAELRDWIADEMANVDPKPYIDYHSKISTAVREKMTRTALRSYAIVDAAKQTNSLLFNRLGLEENSLDLPEIVRYTQLSARMKMFQCVLRSMGVSLRDRQQLSTKMVEKLLPTKTQPAPNNANVLQDIKNSISRLNDLGYSHD